MTVPLAPQALAFGISVSWDDDNNCPKVDPEEAGIPANGTPVPIIWHADQTIASIDKIEFNYKGDDPDGEFSLPGPVVGGKKTWVVADKASREGEFYYMITATKAPDGPKKTLDPMIRNQ